MNIQLQYARKEDLNQIAELEKRCFKTEQFSKKQLSYLLNKAKSIFISVHDNNRPIGYAILLTRKNSLNARLYSIAVDPNVRGLGIASRLLKYAEELALNFKYRSISLEVSELNLAAIKFYHKHDFHVIETRPSYYKDGSNAFKMRKNIHA